MLIDMAFQASMTSFPDATVVRATLLDSFAYCHCGCNLLTSLFLAARCGNSALLNLALKSHFWTASVLKATLAEKAH